MFRLVKLIAIVSASTVNQDEAAANKDATATEKKLSAQLKKESAKLVIGSDTITHSNFKMPGTAFTYDQLQASHTHCVQCLFAGATWTPADTTAGHIAPAKCSLSADKIKALKTADAKKGLDVQITVDETLKYKELFAGLNVCAGVDTDAPFGDAQSFVHTDNGRDYICENGFTDATFLTGVPKGKAGLGYTWDYKWSKQTATTEGAWCYLRTVLPKSYAGGLIVTHTNDDATNVAVKVVSGAVDRYFTKATLKTNSFGKTGKIPLFAAKTIEVFMKQEAKFAAASDNANDFKLTFTRATNFQLAELAASGGVVVWVILGCVLCVLCCVGVFLWKKCSGSKDDADKAFYEIDNYCRV